MRKHEVSFDRSNGLWGARVATLDGQQGRQPSEEECLIALEWLSPFYDHILLLLPRTTLEPWPTLLERAHSVVAVVAAAEIPAALPWLERFCQSLQVQRRVEVAVMGAAALEPAARRRIEKLAGRRVRRLPEGNGLLADSLREKRLLSEAHPEAPLSRSLDALARGIGQIEVGLALGAGGAKGFAHIGVLRLLEEHRVPIDYLAGCSIGAIVGALYAGGTPLEGIERRMRGADRKFIRWTLPLTSIWSDAGLKALLREPGPTVKFEDLAMPFATVATDLVSGREVVLRDGLVWRAVQASVSIPGIFPPTVIAGRHLVDGGLLNPVPTQTVREMGASVVVAVDLMSPTVRTELEATARQSSSKQARRVPNLVEVLWRSNEIMQGEIVVRSVATADVTVRPRLGLRSRFSDFSNRGQSFIAAGEMAAREALPALSQLLPFLNSSSAPEATANERH